jgi:diacylglycerol kinase family enzyme
MTYHILHNPLAGSIRADAPWMAALTAAGHTLREYDVTAVSKDYPGFLASLTAEDAIILHGGDGTINRFVNDTEGMDVPCDILYAPGGTGNDFLRDLDRTAEDGPLSLADYIRDLPFVEVKGKRYRFLNNVGFGIDGYCCEVGDAQKKANPDKKVNYTAVAIKGLLFHYKPTTATVIVDGREYTYKKAWLAPTMKGRYYGGGMNATPAQSRLDPDGKLSVMLFYGKGRLATLMAFPSIFEGKHIRHTDMVAIHEGREICVRFDSPRAVQIDGETITGVTEYRAYAARTLPPDHAAEASSAADAVAASN